MLRVPISELTFGWDHKSKPRTCVIKHNDRVVKRGGYQEMAELFDQITTFNPEDTVAVQYEDEQNGKQTGEPVPEAPSASDGGNAK